MGLPEAIEIIKSSVVQIIFLARGLSIEQMRKSQNPFVSQVLGTGFFVNSEGYVVTAKHVIIGGNEMITNFQAENKQIMVGLAVPNSENIRGNFSLVAYDLIDEDAEHDIVLLKLKNNPFKGEVRSGFIINDSELPLLYGVPTFDSRRPKDGIPIAISGYPLNETVLVTNSGGLATSWGIGRYLGDLEVNPGDSGAPVYKIEDSAIIGLCAAFKTAPVRGKNSYGELSYSSGLTVIVPTKYILDLLKKNKVDYKSLPYP